MSKLNPSLFFQVPQKCSGHCTTSCRGLRASSILLYCWNPSLCPSSIGLGVRYKQGYYMVTEMCRGSSSPADSVPVVGDKVYGIVHAYEK